MPFIRLNHSDIQTLIASLEELGDTISPAESAVLNKLRLIELAQKQSYASKANSKPLAFNENQEPTK